MNGRETKADPQSEARNPKSACPDAATLAAFIRGEAPAEQLDALAAHLDECRVCRERCERDPEQLAFDDNLRWADQAGREVQTDVSIPLRQFREALPEYEVIREIGRGGMGIVFEARHVTLNRPVALKVLPALLRAVREGAADRFKREAELTGRLKHNNIISVYDYGELDGTCYYTMDLVTGRTLKDVLEEIEQTGAIDVVIGNGSGSGSKATLDSPPSREASPVATRRPASPEAASQEQQGNVITSDSGIADLKPQAASLPLTRLGSSSAADKAYYRRVAEWMAEIAEAVQYAHEQGVIHRDIKPSNLMLTDGGRIMITDFGLARAVDHSGVTASRALLGTARYMSPEQADSRLGPIDAKTDIYALGATMYELLAFRPLFTGRDDPEVIQRLLHSEPAPPRRFVRQVPRELETICLKSVEKQRGNRYDSAQALADDLRRWLLDLPIHARRPSLPARVGKFVRRRRLPMSLGAALLLTLVVTAILFTRYRSASQEKMAIQTQADSRAVQVLLYEAKADLFHKGRYAEALAKFDEALAIEPDSVTLLMNRAEALRHLKRHAEAVACMEEALHLEPGNWKIHFHVGRAYEDLPDEKKSADHYRQAERLNPDPAEALCVRAKLADDPQQAVELLTQALDLKPSDTAFLTDRAWRYYALGEHDAMLMDVQQLAGAHPNWAFVQALRGLALFNLGRYAEAERAYSRAIELDPEWPTVWTNRSACRAMTGRFAEALADAGEELRRDPQYAPAYFNRCRARRGLGDLDEALADCERAIRLDPTNVRFHSERGYLFGQMGRWQDSADAYGCAIQLDSNSVSDYGSRGVAFLESKQYDRAVADFTRCIELSPDDVRPYQSRAFAYHFSQRFEQAIADYTRAVQMDPDYAEGYNNRSDCLMRLGRYAEAAADLTQLMTMRSSPSDRMQRGCAYELAGDADAALADYAAALGEPGPVGQYARLWQYLLLQQTGRTQAAAEVLATHVAGAADNAWTDRVFELLAGDLMPEGFLAAVATEEERAEAYYYVGRRALLNGDQAAAHTAFEACLALNRDGVTEVDFARALLDRLRLSGHGIDEERP
ncbi:MAG: tetratricopeptide repeat protein [Phycisphaerae bacterium]|jgi:serine/threonine protein kinase/Flp pilus assembly protein TadD